ncbi:MAG: hypothetical protein QF775_00960 [archaeon]|jgi:hypothetical protein|nr:hypothetical protein [Euryarchaeota archaeon]MDP6704037.1 hypothetical protein [archaeon]MDP7260644.1 hypothetical protein [archaeon]|tara:strand:+ start:24044 stop:24634 length:591 start_codon:yes stop_codon:yes gene_type:complete
MAKNALSKKADKHFKEVLVAINKKKDWLSGNFKGLTQPANNPKKELDILLDLVNTLEDDEEELRAALLAVEVETRRLLESIESEEELAHFGKKGEFLLGKEKELSRAIDHQINLLYNLHTLIRDIISDILKKSELHIKAGTVLSNLDSQLSYLETIIFEEELPNLTISFNELEFEHWPEIHKRLHELKLKLKPMPS